MAKYLIIQSESGLPCAIIFNEALSHKDVAGNMKVISAGFVEIRENKCDGGLFAKTFGYSESLNANSNPRDKDYIELALNH